MGGFSSLTQIEKEKMAKRNIKDKIEK